MNRDCVFSSVTAFLEGADIFPVCEDASIRIKDDAMA